MQKFFFMTIVLVISLFFIFDYVQSNKIKNIEHVLQRDTTTTKGVKTVADIVVRMKTIDLSGCPNDFRAAYTTHIHAWELMAEVEKEAIAYKANFESAGAFVEAFIRGAMMDPFGKAKESYAAKKELKANYQKASTQVRNTFHRVEEIAVSYGASLPKKS